MINFLMTILLYAILIWKKSGDTSIVLHVSLCVCMSAETFNLV